MNKTFARSVFILFCGTILSAVVYYAPWWGMMDDSTCFNIAANFWEHPGIHSFYNQERIEMTTIGRFRPLFQLWIISVYSLFKNFPAGLYFCMSLIGLAVLLVWGKIINKIFPGSPAIDFNFFVYPLSFFIFTPFWNNFMYVSTQEKFIYFFATFSFYFFIRAYEANKLLYTVVSFIFMGLGMLCKETGVALAGVFSLYSLLDFLVFHKNKRISLFGFGVATSIFIGYYFFIRSIWVGNYSVLYKNNLNVGNMFAAILAAPLVIKGLIIIAAIAVCAGLIFFVYRKENLMRQEFLIFPLFMGAYLVILSPWSFANFYLAPIAPSLMLTLYPAYMLINAKSLLLRRVFDYLLIFLIALVLFFIIIPRIAKMGDNKKIVSAIISMHEGGSPEQFFMAPPFAETAVNLQAYTGTSIIYVASSINENMLLPGAANYLIFEDRYAPVNLRDVVVDKEVYKSRAWKIYSLKKSLGARSVFIPEFGENFLQMIKDRIKAAR